MRKKSLRCNADSINSNIGEVEKHHWQILTKMYFMSALYTIEMN